MLTKVWMCDSKNCDCKELFRTKAQYISHLKEVGRINLCKRLAKKMRKSLRLRSTAAAKKAEAAGQDHSALRDFLVSIETDMYRLACYKAEILYNCDAVRRSDPEQPLMINTFVRYKKGTNRFEVGLSAVDTHKRTFMPGDKRGSSVDDYFVVNSGSGSYTKYYIYTKDGSWGRTSSRAKSPSIGSAINDIFKAGGYNGFTLKRSPWEFLNDEFKDWLTEAEAAFETDCEHEKNIAILKGEAYSKPSFNPSDWKQGPEYRNYGDKDFENYCLAV